MARLKIVLDPGHGGRDPGAVGPSDLKECDVVLNVCKHLAAYLCSFVEVYMTRWIDKELGQSDVADLQARCDQANAVQADLFISVHCNSATDVTAHGVETFIYATGGEAEKLARLVQAELVAATGLTDRGVKVANFHVLRETAMPAVLVELAFISNPEEEKLLADGVFQAKCAEAIASGVKKFLQIEGEKMAEPWQDLIMEWARDPHKLGISAEHQADESAPKWFVLAIAQRTIELAKQEILDELVRRLNREAK